MRIRTTRRETLKLGAMATVGVAGTSGGTFGPAADDGLLLTADLMFDGHRFVEKAAVLVRGGKVIRSGPARAVRDPSARRLALGPATIAPGMIDLHVHATQNRVPFDRILAHGVTTIRDLGGDLRAAHGGHGGPGRLRYVAAGPLVTVPGGYPIPVWGTGLAAVIDGPESARETVARLVGQGAAVIKLALEPGGEAGAPWSGDHASTPPPWPLPSVEEARAVVQEAHRRGRKVTAHIGEERGARIALDAGVDEWAHSPSDPIPEDLLEKAARRGVRMVGTLDTQSHTKGAVRNAKLFVSHGGRLLYGTDMAHPEIPHGFDSQELSLMTHVGLSLEEALAGATSLAGEQLGLAPLGSLRPGAPADLVAAAGDIRQGHGAVKSLEYPFLVMTGGRLVVTP
ncbi:amidohydrolase family protein [Nonomuraea africana]|uniref:Imidazolonepropionase-like amidohydrolase n=1 Tax=Nonomuraea africana TaxID=46171 RepID=A0ABR9KPS9_9ACTN|nr:amidohydrolase family protein [Nonomuraea africana]MBE1564034.1 imidazolonepropionase-like amidohydrolase [Nonomuraea africana]